MSAGQPLVWQLSEAEAEAYRSLHLHLLQVSPDAYGSSARSLTPPTGCAPTAIQK